MNLKIAVRSLFKSPVFAVVSLFVLALGIGANTAIFSVVNAVMLRPLPYRDPARIVALKTLWTNDGHTSNVSLPDFLDWQQQSTSFEAVAYYESGATSLYGNGAAERVEGATASDQFFSVFGVAPERGRTFHPGERNSATSVAVISHNLWLRLFHADPQALGQSVKLFQHEFTVVGVMPPGFNFPEQSDIWVPAYAYMVDIYGESRSGQNFQAVARLKPGVTLVTARAEMQTIGARLARQYPEDSKKSIAVLPLHAELVRQVRSTLYLLLGAVVVVLLIACANVANLMLAKVQERCQEIAVRAALGATRGHLARQLLTEALTLAVPAGAFGLLIGWWSASALAHLAPAGLAKTTITMDWRVALFTAAVSILSAVVFGLAPALHGSDAELNSTLQAGGSYSVVRGGSGRLRAAIVVGEIALSMALLIGASVLLRSLFALSAVDPGFRVQGVSVMDAQFPALGLEDARHAVTFYSALLQRADHLPGIEQVAATNTLPNHEGSDGMFYIEGRPKPAPGDFFRQHAGFMLVSPGYFRVLGIPVLTGRDFDQRDNPNGLRTCIVNRALARKFFPGQDAVGQRLANGYDSDPDKDPHPYMTVVGVVGDVRQMNLERPPEPFIYEPYEQHPLPATYMKVLYRTPHPEAASTVLRDQVRHLNPEVTLRFFPLTDVIETSLAPSRFRSLLVGMFAGLALLLAVAGLYGVMAYSVAQRSGEIGVRLALGARPAQISRMILKQGIRLIVPGILAGAALALAAGRLIVSLVFGVKTSDPLTYVGVALLLGLVALLAMYLPARRAARIDPILALRNQ